MIIYTLYDYFKLYPYVIKQRRVDNPDFEKAKEEGRREGKEEGREEGKEAGIMSVAKKLLEEKMDLDFIIRITGLTKEQLMKI